MKLRIRETLRSLSNDCYITSDAMDIAKMCLNKKEPFRILYDAQTNYYMIGNAWDFIHMNLLDKAFKNGWYDSQKDLCDEFIGYFSRNSSTDYWTRGTELVYLDEEELDTSLLSNRVDKDENNIYPWLYCFGFIPNGEEGKRDLQKDGYNHHYYYSFGDLYTRDFELHEVPDLERAFAKIDEGYMT